MMTLTNFAFLKKSDGFKSFLLLSWSRVWFLTIINVFLVIVINDKKHNLNKLTRKPVHKTGIRSRHQLIDRRLFPDSALRSPVNFSKGLFQERRYWKGCQAAGLGKKKRRFLENNIEVYVI